MSTAAATRPQPDMLRVALAYAAKGWPVFPLAPRSKVPLLSKEDGGNGGLDATIDADQIRQWWKKTPAANIGLATGRAFWVVDIDPDGMPWLEANELSSPHEAVTGRGGRHLLYRMPSGAVIKNSAGKIAPGVDIRGIGGYIMAAPSETVICTSCGETVDKHPAGCKKAGTRPGQYRWIDCDGDVPNSPFMEAPPWLVDMAMKTGETNKKFSMPAVIPQGQRDNALYKFAASMRAHSFEAAEIRAALTAANARCVPPLPDADLDRISRSVCTKPPGKSARFQTKAAPAPAPGPVLVPTGEGAPADTAGVVEDWRNLLIRKKATKAQQAAGGTPPALANLVNAVTALTHAKEWAGVLAFDEFACRIVAARKPPFTRQPGLWTDPDTSRTTCWLQKNGVNVNTAIAGEAAQTVAIERRFHPVREYLNGLKWDGRPRIAQWAKTYLGAEKDVECLFAKMWLISAVARIKRPGEKVDTAIILEGGQGEKKSTALGNLLPTRDWFADRMSDIGTKDSLQECNGVWIVEIAEFDAHIKGREAGKVKAFMSSASNRFRLPYGHMVMDFPRQCVFAGTTNKTNYLQDETGSRRFWPIECGVIDADGIKAVRDQLWAEAVHEFDRGTPWWIVDDENGKAARKEQEARYEPGAWDDSIAVWLTENKKTDVSVAEVLINCLDKPPQMWQQRDANAVVKALSHLKWKQYRVSGSGSRRYKAPL